MTLQNCQTDGPTSPDLISKQPTQPSFENVLPQQKMEEGANVIPSDLNSLCNQLYSMDMRPNQQLWQLEQIHHDDSYEKEQLTRASDCAANFTADEDGDNRLHTAIIFQEWTMTMIFISQAASPSWLSFQNKLSQSPLHLAVLTNQVDVVRKLVASGADILSRDRNGNSPLHLACRDGLIGVAKALLEPLKQTETMHNRFHIPNRSIPQDLSLVNYEGLSCLNLAARSCHLNIVELLLQKGADINIREGKTGRTILHNACINGDILLVRALTKLKTCDVNARAYDGLTAFDFARARSHETVCMILAAAGARYGYEEDDSD